MKVRVITPMKTARGVTPAGSIIDIPDNLLPRLRGKVEPVPTYTEPELFNLLGREMEEVDRAGRPWTGFYKSLSAEKRQKLKEINRRIDDTYEALDRDGLVAALVEYREFCFSNRSLH